MPARGEVLRHTAFNISGAVVPLLVAFGCIPLVIRGLGLERYGVLTLAVAIVGYFGVFDLGLGRATTRFMAAALGTGDQAAAAEYFWTALAANSLLGLLGGLVFWAASPFLGHHVLKVTPDLTGEVTWALRGIAGLIPLTVVNSALIGSLEAQRRFGLVNALQVPAQSLVQLVPLGILAFTTNVAVVVLGLVAVRLALAISVMVACLRSLPVLRRPAVRRERLPELLSFGGWLTVTNIMAPLMVNGDRFAIGALLALGAVPYYATPYDVVTRVSLLASGLSRSLFPVFGASGAEDRASFVPLVMRATRLLALVLAVVLVPVMILSRTLLTLWIGASFAAHASPVLVITALGTLINSLAFTPYSLVQGLGRPDITAKFHLLELLVYAPLFVGLLLVAGVAGAAVAWTLRVTLDLVLLLGATRGMLDPRLERAEWAQLARLGLTLGPVLAAALVLGLVSLPLVARLAAAAALEAALLGLAWRLLVDRDEWSWMGARVGRLVPRRADA